MSHDGRAAVTRILNGTACDVDGQGSTVVLIHGVGMQRSIWEPQRQALCDAGYQVICYDMLGHGGSMLPPEQATLQDYAEQLHRLLDDLQVPRAAVVGHSMGGLVALEFALTYPDRVTKVVALNAVFQRTPEQRQAVVDRALALGTQGAAATLEQTLERWFGQPVPAGLQAVADQVGTYLRETHPLGYARSYRVFATSDAVHADRLGSLAVPALFMTGELDLNSSPAMSEDMARLVPNAQIDIVEGAKHKMPLTCAQRVNMRLLNFLDTDS